VKRRTNQDVVCRRKCIEQIEHLEQQHCAIAKALAELRRII
jgi:hypothetical protein